VTTCLILSCLAALISIPRAGDDPSEVEFYESKIRPVLEKECYACHSAKAKELKAGLRLDTRRGLIDGGDSGPAVLPGKPDDSLLIRVIEHASEIAMMPPDKRLPDEVIADFREWVASGIPGLPKDAPDPCGAATSGCSTFSPARLAIPGVAGPGRDGIASKCGSPELPRAFAIGPAREGRDPPGADSRSTGRVSASILSRSMPAPGTYQRRRTWRRPAMRSGLDPAPCCDYIRLDEFKPGLKRSGTSRPDAQRLGRLASRCGP
jgi:hypothetical protein